MDENGIRSQLNALLLEHGARRGTHLWLVDELAEVAPLLATALPAGRWAVVCDPTTRRIAGEELARGVDAGAVVEIAPRARGMAPVAGTREADALGDRLRAVVDDDGIVAVIAVGAGTVNDLAKITCNRLALPYAAVATAPSMNGYTSAGAALLEAGIKTTVSCAPPDAVIAPVSLSRAAPPAMLQAGLADLRSRPVSGADWYLAHRLLDMPYDTDALELAAVAERVTSGTAAGLRHGDGEAVARLLTGLLLSGLAMDIAGTSAPASGGEHLVSHYLDMRHFAHGGPHDLHGRQVGVASLAMAHLYERLLRLDVEDIDPQAAAETTPWSRARVELEAHFGSLWPALADTAVAVHADTGAVVARLEALRRQWPQLRAALAAIVGGPGPLRAELSAAGAPVCFADLELNRDQARDALLRSRYVRTRYTILDLAAELGHLEDWVEETLACVA